MKRTDISFNNVRKLNRSISREISQAMNRVLDHGEFIQGKEVAAFEEAWAEYLGISHAIGVSNGTDALTLALRALAIGPEDEVITTSHTFIATVEAIVSVGAIPVFVDILPDSGVMDVSKLEKAISEKTRAIVPVHLYGNPVDMESVLRITRKHSLKCIEDAAQAHGVLFKGKMLGTWGDAGCFSFYPGKNLGAIGDAGAVVTQDSALAADLKALRDHGRVSKYDHQIFGWNMRMDALQAAVLSAKLPYLDQWNQVRSEIAAVYRQGLDGVNGLSLPPHPGKIADEIPFHLYVIRHSQRDALADQLKKRKVETGVHYPVPVHKQRAWLTHYSALDLPVTELFAATCLSLPLFGVMSPGEARQVISRLLSEIEGNNLDKRVPRAIAV